MSRNLQPRERSALTTNIPDDLADHARTMTGAELSKHYGVSDSTICRWLKKTGINAVRASETDYSDLPELAKTMWVAALARHYDKKISTIRYQLAKQGIEAIQAPDHVFKNRGGAYLKPAAPAVKPSDVSDRAAEFLRRFGPVYKCTETGQPDITGKFWRYGRAVKTPEELIDRAHAKGWNENSWRQAA